jgi:hypothetical protein
MTKSKRTILLSLVGTLIGASTIAVLANPAKANELLYGEYIVTRSTTTPAPAFIAFRTSSNGQIITQHLRCVLPNGLNSQSCFIQQFNLNLGVNLIQQGQYKGKIEVDYLPLEIWAGNHDLDVVSIDAEAPVIQKAEATWYDPWGRWVCAVEDRDLEDCNFHCGDGGGTVSVTTYGSSANKLWEPSCEVTCDCNVADDSDTTWIDAPEVLPG